MDSTELVKSVLIPIITSSLVSGIILALMKYFNDRLLAEHKSVIDSRLKEYELRLKFELDIQIKNHDIELQKQLADYNSHLQLSSEIAKERHDGYIALSQLVEQSYKMASHELSLVRGMLKLGSLKRTGLIPEAEAKLLSQYFHSLEDWLMNYAIYLSRSDVYSCADRYRRCLVEIWLTDYRLRNQDTMNFAIQDLHNDVNEMLNELSEYHRALRESLIAALD